MQTIKFLEVNIEEEKSYFGIAIEFYIQHQKYSNYLKKKFDKLDLIKIKNVCSSKEPL